MIENLIFVIIFSFWGFLTSVRIRSLQTSKNSTCQKAYHSKYAFWGKVRVVNLALLFYLSFLIQAFHALHLQEVMPFMKIQAIIGVLATVYCAYILFWKLKTFCTPCISLYVANLAMTLFIFF